MDNIYGKLIGKWILTKYTFIGEGSDTYDEDYPGDTRKTKIKSKRLGTIWFIESKFSGFVSDLNKATNGKYNYSGGCDLVMIPFINKELKYDNCKVYHLDSN